MTEPAAATAWAGGRLDARRGPRRLLFGRMYEDAAIERAAFPPGGRVVCIASAGCTAMALAPEHEVTAVDVNPVQLAYAARRIAGAPAARGSAERLLAAGRLLMPLVGWRRARLQAFLALEDPAEQAACWRRLETRRLRLALGLLFSPQALRAVYAPALLRVLPARFGRVLCARLARGFARHPNRANPHARALLLGDAAAPSPPPEARRIRLVHADVAGHLERAPAASVDGFALSNVLDGAEPSYARRLLAAVERAAAPGAVVVLRSFAEPLEAAARDGAAADRALLWGSVLVAPAGALRVVDTPGGPAWQGGERTRD